MTTFSFSTGNPSNLTGGATASMTDISGSLTDVKTFLNGASITDTNVQAAGLTDTSLASPTSAVWRTVATGHGYMQGTLTTASWYYSVTGQSIASASGSSGALAIWAPPTTGSDITVAGKTTRLRVRVVYWTNATAPGINVTWGLYPVTVLAGAANFMVPTLGTVVAGSTAVAAAPGGGTGSQATGASFDLSAVTATGAGTFVIGVTGSGAQNVNSQVSCQMFLEMRHT